MVRRWFCICGRSCESTKGEEITYGQNYTAATFQRRVFSRSTLKGFFLNRQAFEDTESQRDDYGRNAGLEFTYFTNNGNFRAWGGYNHSFKKGFSDKNYMVKTGFRYGGLNWGAFLSYNFVGDNYFADMGFLQNIETVTDIFADTTFRQGYHQMFNQLSHIFYMGKNSKLNTQRIAVSNNIRATPSKHLYYRRTELEYEMRFKDRSNLDFQLANNEVELFSDFFYTDSDSLVQDRYNYTNLEIEYRSDSRKTLGYETRLIFGEFYNGMRTSIRVGANYRTRPWGNFGVRMEYNKLTFPEPFADVDLLLISPRVEINFSKSIFWTTFLQYNTQADNFNINSRLQWRFKPMSDLFLVYTDNYAVEVFGKKNRAIVFKMNYWLNI